MLFKKFCNSSLIHKTYYICHDDSNKKNQDLPARCDSTAALRRLRPVGEFFRCKSARQNKDIHFTQKVKKSHKKYLQKQNTKTK